MADVIINGKSYPGGTIVGPNGNPGIYVQGNFVPVSPSNPTLVTKNPTGKQNWETPKSGQTIVIDPLRQREIANYKDPNAGSGGMGFGDFIGEFGSSNANNGFDSAAYVAKLVNQINEGYDRRIGSLGQNRLGSLAQISNLSDQYKQNMGGINQSYLQGVAAQNQEIARRAAEQQAMAQRTAEQLSTSLAGEGISAQPIQGQAQNIANTLATTNQFQRDLQDRMAQLAASSQAGSLAGGELVRQGAAGNLENNYNSMLNALQTAREQQIMEAQAPRSSGGGGGGGSSDPLDQATKYLKAYQLYNDVMGGGSGFDIQSLMSAAAEKQPFDLLQGLASNPELAKYFQ